MSDSIDYWADSIPDEETRRAVADIEVEDIAIVKMDWVAGSWITYPPHIDLFLRGLKEATIPRDLSRDRSESVALELKSGKTLRFTYGISAIADAFSPPFVVAIRAYGQECPIIPWPEPLDPSLWEEEEAAIRNNAENWDQSMPYDEIRKAVENVRPEDIAEITVDFIPDPVRDPAIIKLFLRGLQEATIPRNWSYNRATAVVLVFKNGERSEQFTYATNEIADAFSPPFAVGLRAVGLPCPEPPIFDALDPSQWKEEEMKLRGMHT